MTISNLSGNFFVQSTSLYQSLRRSDEQNPIIQMNKEANEAKIREEEVKQEEKKQLQQTKEAKTNVNTIFKQLDVETERKVYFDLTLKPKTAEETAVVQNPFVSEDASKKQTFQEKLEIIRAGLYKQIMANVTQQPAYALAVNA